MDEYKKKVILERLKTTGQYEEFIKAIKAAGKDPWILFYESGQVVVMGDEGGRFTKTGRTFFDSEGMKEESRAFSLNTKRMIGFVVEFLREQGIKLRDDITGMALSGAKIRESNQFERDSKLDLAARYLESGDAALDERNTVETRLAAAYELGNIWRCMVVNNFYGQTQTKIAKQERKKGLNSVFSKLKQRKVAGARPKELWPEFIDLLQADHESFDKVIELVSNPANCKTWSVQFSLIPDSDNEEIKEETMKYDRFVRRLNEK